MKSAQLVDSNCFPQVFLQNRRQPDTQALLIYKASQFVKKLMSKTFYQTQQTDLKLWRLQTLSANLCKISRLKPETCFREAHADLEYSAVEFPL